MTELAVLAGVDAATEGCPPVRQNALATRSGSQISISGSLSILRLLGPFLQSYLLSFLGLVDLSVHSIALQDASKASPWTKFPGKGWLL